MSDQNLGKFSEGFASWRKVMAAMTDDALRLEVFANAAADVATYVSKGLNRAIAADELTDIATANGLADHDQVQGIIAEAFARVEDPARVPDDIGDNRKTNGKRSGRIRYLSRKEFRRMFERPDYLVDGILQRRYVYALTGQTGHAKTAIALLIADLVSSSQPNDGMLGNHRVERGHVIYFVGENPVDTSMRVIGADSLREDDPDSDNITFIPGQFNIAEMYSELADYANSVGGVKLIIVDTSAAYFLGQDENANPQMGAHARMLRKLTELPGGPCVLVLCHPIKYTSEASQLLPRGGGAFLAEMDGNLTAWKHDDTLIELHHTKIRGPGFESMTFKLETIRTDKLTDTKDRILPTVRAVAISQSDEEQQTKRTRSDEDHLLAVLLKNGETVSSIADIAMQCGWTVGDGAPAKSRTFRGLERLEKARPSLTYRDRGQWKLTEKGKDAARKAALRIAAQEEAERNAQFRMDLH